MFSDSIMVMDLPFLDKADSEMRGDLPVDSGAEDVIVVAEGLLSVVHW